MLQSLAVRSCVLEVKSWSDNNVSVNPYLTNVILCSDKKGQGLQAQLSPSEVQILLKRRQISAGSSLRAGSPQCLSADCRCHQVAEAGMGEGFFAALRSGLGQWVALARTVEPGRTLPRAVPCGPPVPPSDPSQVS